MSKTVYPTGQYIEYCYDGDQVIAEYDGTGTLLRKYIYGPGVDEPICMIAVDGQTETRYYYHYDGLGSVVALSNHSGTIVERYKYSAFGETTVCDSSGTPRTLNQSAYGNSCMFTGREYNSETGLYYYRARFYKSTIGRFLQTDPIGYSDSMNLYAYVGNNPTCYVDPMGLRMMGPNLEFDNFGPPEVWDMGKPDWSIPNTNTVLLQTAYQYVKDKHPEIYKGTPRLVPANLTWLPGDAVGLGIFNTLYIDVDAIHKNFGEEADSYLIAFTAHELMHLENGFWKTAFGFHDHEAIYNRAEEIRSVYNKKRGWGGK